MKKIKYILLVVFAGLLTSSSFAGTFIEPSVGVMLDGEVENTTLATVGNPDFDNMPLSLGLLLGQKFYNGFKLSLAAHYTDGIDFEGASDDGKLLDAGLELGYEFHTGVHVFVGYSAFGSLEVDDGEYEDISGVYYGIGVHNLPWGLNAQLTYADRDFDDVSGFGNPTASTDATMRTITFSLSYPYDLMSGNSRSRRSPRRRYR